MNPDPVKELQRTLLALGALPDQFTSSDVSELKSMGISIDNAEPQLHEYAKKYQD